jgi:hypothetical protein
MTGVHAELILANDARSTPHKRRLAGECGTDMVTSVPGGLKDPPATVSRGGDAVNVSFDKTSSARTAGAGVGAPRRSGSGAPAG